ncbi:MAG: lipid-A-disaccharide synthase-related protein [Elainellaceae cyanobacterium]
MNEPVPKRLLCLSNGHGEDAIALSILSALRQLPDAPELYALPLVGEGKAFQNSSIPILGRTQKMPSGGFIYMDGRQLMRDVKGGLVQLTITQLKTVRQWAKQGGAILAVGDIVPLLFAWWSGAPYGFVGTAKSDYYLRDEQGWLPRADWFERLERWSGSVYLPWERWLMQRPRCKAVFPRDTLTAEGLSRWKIPVADLGNPMMDDRDPRQSLVMAEETEDASPPPLTLVLLPGSRIPETYRNWERILKAIHSIQQQLPHRTLHLLGAIAPSVETHLLSEAMQRYHWRVKPEPRQSLDQKFTPQISQDVMPSSRPIYLTQPGANPQISHTCCLTSSAFGDCLHAADVAIATTGTATEQFIGLGKPAIILPGDGPQFTSAFAEAQTRLLGVSVTIADEPEKTGQILTRLLNDPDRLNHIYHNGISRMGTPGAGDRIARHLVRSIGWNDD